MGYANGHGGRRGLAVAQVPDFALRAAPGRPRYSGTQVLGFCPCRPIQTRYDGGMGGSGRSDRGWQAEVEDARFLTSWREA
jgi:hypothetical protein